MAFLWLSWSATGKGLLPPGETRAWGALPSSSSFWGGTTITQEERWKGLAVAGVGGKGRSNSTVVSRA